MEKSENPLAIALKKGKLEKLVEKYIKFCYGDDGNDGKNSRKVKRRFPNVAGFCRFLKIGSSEFELLCSQYPVEFEWLKSVFEDEALNCEVSPTVISAYLKKRLEYEKTVGSEVCDGGIKIVFDHDIMEDGE